MEIRKKTWPEYFEKIINEKKKIEVRLADFKIKEGDILILEEYNPKTKQYTGRKIKKKVKRLFMFNPIKAHSFKDIKKFGFYEIELE
jgi:ASC-1-like (ASCH) protein